MKGAKIFGITVGIIFIIISICLGYMGSTGSLDNINKKYDYTTSIQQSITSIYPDAQFSFSNFREWEASGIDFQEGSFTYTNSYNQKSTSTYLARGCMGEIFYFRIDDTVLLNDTDKYLELTEKYNNSKSE